MNRESILVYDYYFLSIFRVRFCILPNTQIVQRVRCGNVLGGVFAGAASCAYDTVVDEDFHIEDPRMVRAGHSGRVIAR